MDDKIRLAVLIERFKSHLAKHFDKTSQELDEILQDFLVKHDISDINHKEIKELIKENHQLFLMALAGFATKLKDEWREFYDIQADFEFKFAKNHRAELPNTPKKELSHAIKQISYNQALLDRPQSLLRGVSLNDLLGNFSKDEADRLTAVIRLAHHEGWANHKLIQAIRGTRAGKFKDGILQTTRRHAETLARTGTAIMAGEAQKEFANKNRDLVKGVQIIATLDRRTCLVAGTLIDTPTGRRPIEEIKKGELVFGGSGKVREVTATLKSYKNRLCKVTLSNGETIVCTQDHRWWNGREWIEAKDLRIGDFLPKTL